MSFIVWDVRIKGSKEREERDPVEDELTYNSTNKTAVFKRCEAKGVLASYRGLEICL